MKRPKAKPRIQVKKAPDSAWEDLATIESYPATTATDSKGLAEGKEFIVRFEPVKVVAIRVIGAPACGDGPKQSFAGCAELQGSMEGLSERNQDGGVERSLCGRSRSSLSIRHRSLRTSGGSLWAQGYEQGN